MHLSRRCRPLLGTLPKSLLADGNLNTLELGGQQVKDTIGDSDVVGDIELYLGVLMNDLLVVFLSRWYNLSSWKNIRAVLYRDLDILRNKG